MKGTLDFGLHYTFETNVNLVATRPDLCLSVGICARYQACPKESHMNAVKRVIIYVKGTLDFGLHYTFETNVNLAGFCDADGAGCLDDRHSTSC